jgi:hypothetical protein
MASIIYMSFNFSSQIFLITFFNKCHWKRLFSDNACIRSKQRNFCSPQDHNVVSKEIELND